MCLIEIFIFSINQLRGGGGYYEGRKANCCHPRFWHGNEWNSQFNNVGGHTAEMFRLLNNIDDDLQPTDFILCDDDKLALLILNTRVDQFNLIVSPRPRKVGQSYFTSIFTSIWTIVYWLYYLSSHSQIDLVPSHQHTQTY